MATELLEGGVRRYTLLTPVSLEVDKRPVVYRAVHILPVTRRTEREWQDGLIDGPYGMLEALIARLTYEPYYVIEEMQHPDVELFNREFMIHLPRSISDALARGEYPMAAATPPRFDHPEPPAPDYDDPGPPAADWPTRPPPPIPRDPTPSQMAPAPAPDPHEHMDGANYELAHAGPDDSLGTPEQRRRSEQARQEAMGDGREMARELVAEEPASPLAAAVQRTQAPPSFKPTPRNPFDPTPEPPKVSVNRPPTRLSAEGMPIAAALPQTQAAPPGVDPKTGREAVFAPKGDYVPDMSAAGYEEPVQQSRANNAFGIGDIEP